MSINCLVCDYEHAGHRHACDCCVTKLRHQLRGIETYASVLHVLAQLGRNGLGSRGAPGFGSRSPARDEVIVAMDVRSKGDLLGPDDVEQPIISIPSGIHWIANGVRHELTPHVPVPPRWSVTSEVAYLLSQLPAVAMHAWVDRFAAMVGKLHQQARMLARDQPPPPLARCLVVGCEGLVYAEQRRDGPTMPSGARCAACSRLYTGLDLVRLSVAQEAS